MPRRPSRGLSPVSGSTDGGASVVSTGTSFTQASAVTFGGVDATSYTVESATKITAVVPAHDAGSVRVKVTTPSGSSPDTVAGAYTYAEVTVPAITGISPVSGAPGNSVVITGTGFVGIIGAGRGRLRGHRCSQLHGGLPHADNGRSLLLMPPVTCRCR